MATSRADFQNEEKQNCPICLGDFKIPRQLPCMHSFCEKCLQDYLLSQEEKINRSKQIECPICRQGVCVSKQGSPVPSLASQFPIDVILQSILSDSKVKVDQPCEICHSTGISSQAQDMCVVCEEAMCTACSVVHRNQKISRYHVIISMEEFSFNPQNVMKFAKGFSCPEHDGEAIEFYCKDHKAACCSKCCIVRHRNCANFSELKKELPNLLQEIDADSINEQIKRIETHLQKFIEVNESNISLLESQVNDLTSQIRDLRKKINDVLDELETKVKREGHRICKEETIQKQEKNHHCQSLINAIRNSHKQLETVKKYGTEMQVFLLTEKMTSQLSSYLNQIQEKYMKTETTKVRLEVSPKVKSMFSANLDHLAKIVSKQKLQSLTFPCLMERVIEQKLQSLPFPCFKRPSRDHLAQMERIIEIKDNDNLLPDFSGITYLYSGHMVLADYANSRVCLVDSSNNSTIGYNLPDRIFDICLVNDDNEVAVTLPWKNTVQFLSVTNGKITPTRKLSHRYVCHGVAAAGKGKIVISGFIGGLESKYFWSFISMGGKEEYCHEFKCLCYVSLTHVAMDLSLNHVYMTVSGVHSLYCFDITGIQKFVYTNDNLKLPRGVATDRYDNVYVVGYGSNNIHQITPSGIVLQIISAGPLVKPQAICFRRDSDKIVVANVSDRKLYQYQVK